MQDLRDAYVRGVAGAFFEAHYGDAADRRRALLRARRPLSSVVANALTQQNAAFGTGAARAAHVRALCNGAVAVVTGQQVGLFLGPLFTLYKTASAIAVARALSAEIGETVVPVFWLQTEDHDLAEVAVTHVPRASGEPLTLEIASPPDHRVSLAHCTLPEDVVGCLDRLRDELGNLPHAGAHLSHLQSHYRPGAGWSKAFAGLLADLFADEGLVLIDARDASLAEATIPVHRRALAEANSIAAQLSARTQSLRDAGYAATVHVRPGAPLSFFHPDGAAGPRYRLDATADGYVIKGQRTYAIDELLAVLEAEPLRFSTSALLRPLLQDSLLPTAAYIAGPAETAYHAQLPPLYAAFGLPMPLIVPRAHFRILEGKTRRLSSRLQLQAADARLTEDELLERARVPRTMMPTGSELTASLIETFQEKLRELAAPVEGAGPGLHKAIEKTQASVAAAVSKLAAKYDSARLHQDEQLVADVRRFKQALYPQDVPQERFYGLSYFAARYGEHELVARVVDAVAPFDPTARDLSWDDDLAEAHP